MKKRRMIPCALALALSAAMFAACGEGDIPPQEIDVNLDKNTSAQLVALVGQDALEKSLLEGVAAEFNKVYPNIRVDVVMNSDPISYVRSGDPVDIIMMTGEEVTQYSSQQNILESLDPYMEAAQFDRSLYYDSMMELGKNAVSGTTYMMPRDYSRIVTFFNKTLFDTCGVPYPTESESEPWTWERMMSTCKAIKDSGKLPQGYAVLQAAMSYDILNWAIVSSYGVTGLLKDDFTVIDSSSDQYQKWQQGMETAREMIELGYSLDSKNYQAEDFQLGRAAMCFAVPASSNACIKGGIDYDVISFPAIGDTPKAPAGTAGYGMAAISKNKNAAWAFLSFLMSDEGQKVFAEQGKLVPVKKSLAEDADAAWRKMTNGKGNPVNVAAMTTFPERDVVATWFGKLPALARRGYQTPYNEFLKSVCDGNAGFAAAVGKFANSIADYQKYYPEYFA